MTVGVAPLGGPETYRQERLVYRTLPNRVGFYPYDRWEIPPVEMMTDALIGYLRASGRFQRVTAMLRDGRVDYVLRGRLLRFDQEDEGPGTPWKAVVEVAFDLIKAQSQEVVRDGIGQVGSLRLNEELVVTVRRGQHQTAPGADGDGPAGRIDHAR